MINNNEFMANSSMMVMQTIWQTIMVKWLLIVIIDTIRVPVMQEHRSVKFEENGPAYA